MATLAITTLILLDPRALYSFLINPRTTLAATVDFVLPVLGISRRYRAHCKKALLSRLCLQILGYLWMADIVTVASIELLAKLQPKFNRYLYTSGFPAVLDWLQIIVGFAIPLLGLFIYPFNGWLTLPAGVENCHVNDTADDLHHHHHQKKSAQEEKPQTFEDKNSKDDTRATTSPSNGIGSLKGSETKETKPIIPSDKDAALLTSPVPTTSDSGIRIEHHRESDHTQIPSTQPAQRENRSSLHSSLQH
ncbi:MAG: hypothetical protein LQ350_008245 [Teloschistes chrysophthalmus]|nr:MAG: hypothetical protein LQ350_008245 [Niorma chrysophthalma]